MARWVPALDAERRIAVDGDALLGRIADAIVRDAQRLVPVDTGRLEDGIEADSPSGGSVKVHSRRPDANPNREGVPVYVELGTRHMAAQPYLKPALYRQRGEVA